MYACTSGVPRLQKLVGPINCNSAENFASDHAHFFEISYEISSSESQVMLIV